MKNLIPVNNAFSHFEQIVDSKRNQIKSRLLRLKPEIKDHYSNYETYVINDNLSKLVKAGYKSQNRISLLNCYTSKTKALDKLKTDIKNKQTLPGNSYCQYCMVRTPDTFDHYIPKEKYCEFAVLSLNLIPCCDPCNRKKSDVWIKNGNRIFINLYYDKIVSYRVLYCSIKYSGNVPTVRFTIRKNKSLSQVQNDLIKKHYTKLELLNLFQDRANVVISETIKTINSVPKKMSSKNIKEFLINDANSSRAQYGINYWEALIKLELSKNKDFYISL